MTRHSYGIENIFTFRVEVINEILLFSGDHTSIIKAHERQCTSHYVNAAVFIVECYAMETTS